jgi:hypothetical protein
MTFTAVLAAWRLVLSRFIAAEIAAMVEKGQPVTLVELNRWYPKVAPQENGAVVLGKAFASLSGPLDPPDKTCHDDDVRPTHDDSPSIEDYLNGNGEALAWLHQASQIPRSRFPVDLGRLSILPYPHLAKLVRSAHLLEAEAANQADRTNIDSAVVSIQSLFALSHSLVKEPLVRSYLARLECQRIAVGSLQDLLTRTSLTDAQLGDLAGVLEKADDPRGLARAFIGQRCIGIHGFNMMRDTLDLTTLPVARSHPLGQRAFINLNALFSSPAYLYDLCGFLQWDELHYLRLMDRYIRTAQMAFPERIETARELRGSLEQLGRLHAFSRVWLRGMNGPRIILKDAAMTTRLRAGRIAIAVERFRLASGRLPHSLSELDPFGMGAVPADPFDGEPLRYRRLTRGYAVYSIAEDSAAGANGSMRIAFTVER